MKNYLKITLTAIAFLFITITASAQSTELYASPTADKLITKTNYGVMITFQNKQYKYVQDYESVVFGSVSTTIKVLELALNGLTDEDDNLNDYNSFYTADFGSTTGVYVNNNSNNKYTILSRNEITLILNKLRG